MDILSRRRNDASAEADFQEPVTKQIAQKESLHSYIVFAAQMSQSKHGSRCHGSFLLAFAIFSLNIVLQLSLTLIAGGYIMEENSEFYNTLITGSSIEGSERLWEDYHALLDPFEWWAGATDIASEHLVTGNASSCCKGPGCTHENECCAPAQPVLDSPEFAKEPSSNADADFVTDAALLQARKPRGRSSGAKKATGKNSRGRGEMNSVGKEKAVCTLEDEALDCAPPASAFAAFWSELDADGDGRWTHEEAVADVQNLGCRLGIAAEEVFRHACRSIVADAEDSAGMLSQGARARLRVQLPAELVERRAITLDYFNWWVGLVAICINMDVAKCGELVEAGLFEGAMAPELKGGRGGVVDLDSAIEYCNRILRPGGLCDMVLPGTFLMFRDRVQEKCGDKIEAVGPRITNPFKETDTRYVTQVSYHNVTDYSTTHSKTFRFFLFLVLVMWYLRLLDEFKECFEFFDFVWNFPSSSQGTLEESDKGKTRSANLESGEPESAEAPSIDWIQRIVVAFTTLVRFWLVVYLANVGTVYHLSTHAYVDLLLNAIALAFILELPEFFYMFMVADDAKSEVEALESFSFTTSMPQGDAIRWIASKPFFGLFVIPVLSIFVVVYNDAYRTQPILEALQCTCLLSGDRCVGSGLYPKAWWDSHWGEVSGLAPIPGQALLGHAPVELDQETFSLAASSLENGPSLRLKENSISPMPSTGAGSRSLAKATAFPDFLLQTNETQRSAKSTDARLRQGTTMRTVDQHVTNVAGLLQIQNARKQAPRQIHEESEL